MASKGKRKRAKRISPLRPPLPSRHSINHSRHVGSQHTWKERIRGKGKESPPLISIQNVKTRKKRGIRLTNALSSRESRPGELSLVHVPESRRPPPPTQKKAGENERPPMAQSAVPRTDHNGQMIRGEKSQDMGRKSVAPKRVSSLLFKSAPVPTEESSRNKQPVHQ